MNLTRPSTQWLINRGIEGYYNKVHNEREKDLVAQAKRRDKSGISNLKFGVPMIIVNPAPGNQSQVYYRLHLLSGDLDMFASENPEDGREVHYKINDWYFAFPVCIGA
jgi:hypothetical protein